MDLSSIEGVLTGLGTILAAFLTYLVGTRRERNRAEEAHAIREAQARAAATLGATEATGLAFAGFKDLIDELAEQNREQAARERALLAELSAARDELAAAREDRMHSAEREGILLSELRILRHEVAMLRSALNDAGMPLPELPPGFSRRAADLPLGASPFDRPVPPPVPGHDRHVTNRDPDEDDDGGPVPARV